MDCCERFPRKDPGVFNLLGPGVLALLPYNSRNTTDKHLLTSCRTSQGSASAPQRAGTFCQPFRSKSFHIPSAFFLRMCWRALKQIKIAEHHFLNGVTRVLCGESNSAPRVTDFFDPLQTGGSQSDTRTHAQLPRFLPERICTRYGTKPLPSRYGYAQRSILTLRHYSHSVVRPSWFECWEGNTKTF